MAVAVSADQLLTLPTRTVRRPQGGRIASVEPGSAAAAAGIAHGDYLYAINGHRLHDVIDYRFYSVESPLTLTVERNGRRFDVLVDAEAGQDLGLGFEDALFTAIRRCANDCDFCFVDMNPAGLRSSIYIRDDDYRLSFLFGDFITLTNLNERDWTRIGEQRLSPLYVSVHVTDTAIRRRLLASARAHPIHEDLDRLGELGVQVHCQVVLCPGINDGEILERTVTELVERHPQVLTVAIVPVGLTKFSEKYDRAGLRRVTAGEARALVERGEAWRRQSLQKHGENTVFLSDEVYVLAGVPLPTARAYAGYPQYENGIGMVRSWLDDLARWARRYERRRAVRGAISANVDHATIVTGQLFAPTMQETARQITGQMGIRLDVVPIVNEFLGDTVTVAGLLAGRDIIAQMRGRIAGDLVLVPRRAVDQRGERFLDGITLDEVAHAAGAPVALGREFADLVKALASV